MFAAYTDGFIKNANSSSASRRRFKAGELEVFNSSIDLTNDALYVLKTVGLLQKYSDIKHVRCSCLFNEV